ncbi:hypothetical protein C8J55DRAFT_424262 [Lentinula edodes]|uniref:Transcription factor TFIIIC triple barrel domain-containing protein n=1 Tax=Lentinula lateritia TaxID=40482 RepID=A0A9W9AMT6_9AGAR|nr:hypothetical protein C8J55DRAFT_424262 [Lentinula edodes]
MASSSAATFPSSPSVGLCPGYRHVEQFGPDEEYEDEVEDLYVTLDLGAVEPTLIPSSSTYRLIGLDTPTPFMQLSGTVLQGRHESLLGTELLFVEGKDAQDRSKRHLSFTSTTEQRIRFKEVQLRPKVPAGADSAVIDRTLERQEPEPATSTQKDHETAPRKRKSKKANETNSATGSMGKAASPKPTKNDKGKAKEVLEDEYMPRDESDDRGASSSHIDPGAGGTQPMYDQE